MNMLMTIICFLFNFRTIYADFCEFGICDVSTEYCCGENLCCKEKVGVWYFWAAVLLAIITMIIILCLCLKKFLNRRSFVYSPLAQTT